MYIKAGVVDTAAGFDLLLGHTPPAEADLPRLVHEAVARMLALIQAAREKHQPALTAAITRGAANLLAAGPWYHAVPTLPARRGIPQRGVIDESTQATAGFQ